jgi:hypothetical protein
MTEKTYRYVGVAREPSVNGVKGVYKVRYANDAGRIKLMKNVWGNTDVDLMELMTPMTKADAVAYLLNCDDYVKNDVEVRECLEQAFDKKTRSIKPATTTAPKVPATTAAVDPKDKLAEILARGRAKAEAKLSKAEIAKQLADLEDAPY